MTQQNDFEKHVKIALILKDKNSKWLAEEVHHVTGLYCSQPYISKTLKGERHSPKIIAAIKKVLEMEE